jgi:hypothetical protein
VDELEKRAVLAFNTGGVLMSLMQSGIAAEPVIDNEGNYETKILVRQLAPFRNVILNVEVADEDA